MYVRDKCICRPYILRTSRTHCCRSFDKNGSIYTLDRAGTTGYCLTTYGGQPGTPVRAGMPVLGSDCGPDPSTRNGHKPTLGIDQLWAVRNGTIASIQPGNPFCFGVPPNQSGVWDPSVSQSGR